MGFYQRLTALDGDQGQLLDIPPLPGS